VKLNIPLFLGIVDAHLAAFAQSKARTPPPKPQPASPPIRLYGSVYGERRPDPVLSW
jgi:hypothetical protein